MSKHLRRISMSPLFNNFILFAIVIAGINVGFQTYKNYAEHHQYILDLIDKIIIWIFVAELIVKIGANGKEPWKYFQDPWNIFDFLIVALCFLPTGKSGFIPIFRLARILRIFKLVTALPKLQIIVGALLKSIPSMGYVFLLMLLHFYMYGCMATFLFGENDPIHFGNLQTSMLSMFRAVTLEDWTDLMYINMYGSDFYGYTPESDVVVSNLGLKRVSSAMPISSVFFFVSFILTGAMIVLNLFIGVIMASMEEMKKESEINEIVKQREKGEVALLDEVILLEDHVRVLSQNLTVLNNRLRLYEKSVSEEKAKLKKGIRV